MKNLSAALILLSVALTSRCEAAEPSVHDRSNRCVVGAWEVATPLSSAGTLLRSPDLAVTSDGPVAVGLNVPRQDSTALGAPFFLGRGAVQTLDPPDGDHPFIGARIAVGPGDRLHLVWGAGEEPLRRGSDTVAPTISALWYAVYDDGGWSRPARLHERGQLRWSRGNGGMAFDPADSVLNIVFDTRPAGEGGPGSSATLLLRVRDGAPIEVDTILRLGNPTRLATAAHGGSSHVAYVHWDTVDEATRVHVASFRAADRRWEAPVVLNRGTRRRTGDVWIFTSPNGALDVLWTERAGDLLFGPTFLHHAWKASASGEWTRDEPFALPGGGGHGWSAVMDRCGGLHFVRAVADERGFPRLEYAEKASGGGWRRVEIPTSGVASLEPVLAAGADGVYLAWSEVGDGSDGGPPGARLMVSRRPIR